MQRGRSCTEWLAKPNGQAIPFAFLFTTNTDGTTPEGAKTRMLSDVLTLGANNDACENHMH
ncbi:hypothetical protein DFH09DRAFT_938784 [Mycena vulgaris]|nr:hypothetical protein DFH09DRAFT_938784 [Mycena vulgaris]